MAKKVLLYLTVLVAGMFLGWLFFHSSHIETIKDKGVAYTTKTIIWTCAMHPQIRMDKAGKCPICGMELIPLNQSNTRVDSDAIHLSKEAAALANVLTVVVTKQKPVNEIRLYGKVQADERKLQSQVTHISGRIEKLLVNFTGEGVYKGQTLASIYSPELITAQQELIETARNKAAQPDIYEAAKAKLRQWKLTEKQIVDIENSGTIQNNFEIVSNTTGVVVARRVNNGDYVSQGSVLFDIADLSSVWLLFDAYESDLAFINKGNKITFTVQALPGKTFTGAVAFIDPVIDPVTRVSKVRVEMSNPIGKLKPEMFATGFVNSQLTEYKNVVVVPRSAVLWTGKRSLVYVKQKNTDEPIFKIREVELGPMLGNGYVISNGLTEGDEIVVQGTFSVDAASQLEGKPSMLNNPVAAEMQMDKLKAYISAVYNVSGNCDMCKERIENAAKEVNGTISASWDSKTKKLKVEYNPGISNSNAILKSIAKAGHDTEKFKATDAAYSSLPECCAYRK